MEPTDPIEPERGEEAPDWKKEYQEHEKIGLAVAYRNRHWMLFGAAMFVGMTIYAFARSHDNLAYGLVPVTLAFVAMFGAMFKKGNSAAAREAAHANADRTPQQLEANRQMNKVRWAVILIVAGMLLGRHAPHDPTWHRPLQIFGYAIAAIAACSIPLIVLPRKKRAASGVAVRNSSAHNQESTVGNVLD